MQRNCEIITTVRSEDKAAQIRNAHPNAKITVALVPDIAKPDAFDEVAKVPGLEVVLHSEHHSRNETWIDELTVDVLEKLPRRFTSIGQMPNPSFSIPQ